MFEDEIKMEEKSSNIMGLLMALALAAAVIGGLTYFYLQSKRTLKPEEAAQIVNQLLAAQGPAKVHFHVGKVEPTVDEKPFDPHYKLLQRAGVVKLGKITYKGVDVALTPEGKQLLDQCGAQQEKNSDGTLAYTVPLATRKLLAISNIEMVTPGFAKVAYTWDWQTNKLGEDFDVKSPEMAKMNTWESSVLIQKYGADFYKDGGPKRVLLSLTWDDKNKVWKQYMP